MRVPDIPNERLEYGTPTSRYSPRTGARSGRNLPLGVNVFVRLRAGTPIGPRNLDEEDLEHELEFEWGCGWCAGDMARCSNGKREPPYLKVDERDAPRMWGVCK
jgi:hypothetical protein